MATDDKKKPRVHVDTSILDAKTIEEVRVQAKAKVEKERIAAAKAQLLEEFEATERQAKGLTEAMEEIFIDLAPYADRLMLDGKILFQGQTKIVRASEAAVIREMMQATWRHQSIVDGKPEDFYRRSRGQRVIPLGNGQAGVSNILRA